MSFEESVKIPLQVEESRCSGGGGRGRGGEGGGGGGSF